MAQPTYSQLVELLTDKDRQIARLEARVIELEAQVRRLTQLLEAAHRGNKRQSAPFSKGTPKPDPKPPGRKPGKDYGESAFRSAPPPSKIDEVHEAALPRRCPSCGGAVQAIHTARQYYVEISRRPIYRQFNVRVGQCACCGRRVQGRHLLQTSDALGAACSQLGPDLQALMAQLNKDAGLSHGKIQRLIQNLFGIALSRAGSVQAVLRAARRCRTLLSGSCESMLLVHINCACGLKHPDERRSCCCSCTAGTQGPANGLPVCAMFVKSFPPRRCGEPRSIHSQVSSSFTQLKMIFPCSTPSASTVMTTAACIIPSSATKPTVPPITSSGRGRRVRESSGPRNTPHGRF